MRSKIFFLIISSFLLHFPSSSQDINQKVKELSEQYRISGIKEDTATMVKLLHPEVTFYGPSGKSLNGKETVSKVVKYFLENNDITSWEVSIDKTHTEKNLLFEYGTFVVNENEGTISERKYLNIWRREKGDYKLFFRTWSPLE